jgi:hypothetical protein
MKFRTGFGRCVLPLAMVVVAGCGSSGGSAPNGDPNANTFTVGANGGTRKLVLSKGITLAFAFPAAAAGKSLTLREVTPASLGLDGKLDAAVEMLPRGETFGSPVLITGIWPGAAPALLSFESASTFDEREPILLSSDGQANALTHFAYLGIAGAGSASACPNGTLEMNSVSTDSTPCCPTGGNATTWWCTQPDACREIVTWPYETCTQGANLCTAKFTPSYSQVNGTCRDGGVDGPIPDAAADGNPSDASDAGDARSDASDAGDARPSGETCAMPIVIAGIPFTDTVNLEAKADDFRVTTPIAKACVENSDGGTTSMALGGLGIGDVVYAYTPTTTGLVTVRISSQGVDARRTVLMIVVQGTCTAPDNYCIGSYLTDPATGNTRTFQLSLMAGTPYFFIVDGGDVVDAGGALAPIATLSITP